MTSRRLKCVELAYLVPTTRSKNRCKGMPGIRSWSAFKRRSSAIPRIPPLDRSSIVSVANILMYSTHSPI